MISSKCDSIHWHGVDLHWAYNELFRSIHRRTGCAHAACDVLHEALLRFALNQTGIAVRQPHAYLRTVVHNLLVDRFQDERRWIAWPDEMQSDENLAGTFVGATMRPLNEQLAPSVEDVAELNQRLASLQRILNCLPPRCGEVYWLYRVEGHTQSEIASKLGITLKVVERHVMRALADIRSVQQQLQ